MSPTHAQVLELSRFYHAAPNAAERATRPERGNGYPSEKEKPQESCDFLGLNPGGLGRNRTIDTRLFRALLYRLSYQATWTYRYAILGEKATRYCRFPTVAGSFKVLPFLVTLNTTS